MKKENNVILEAYNNMYESKTIIVQWDDLIQEDIIYNARRNKLNALDILYKSNVKLNVYREMLDNQENLDELKSIIIGTYDNIYDFFLTNERWKDKFIDKYINKHLVKSVKAWEKENEFEYFSPDMY